MDREWTFMVYMAGDNGRIFEDGNSLMDNLEEYGLQNIAAMSEIGSTDRVAIVVQLDALSTPDFTTRIFIGGKNEARHLVEKIPPVNTGDPACLTEFLTWSWQKYPARHQALVLWNHGTGWKEDDIYEHYREAERAHQKDQTRAAQKRQRLNKSFFLSTAAKIMNIEDDSTRAICYDDSSMDFLDNLTLVQALADTEKVTGRRLDVLGMDACLMSTIEVAHELRGCADFMVASEEIEEGEGWPYDQVLETLIRDPTMSGEVLAKTIVNAFRHHYESRNRGGGSNTQAAVALQRISSILGHATALCDGIMKQYDRDFSVERSLIRAKQSVERFYDRDFADLGHFCQLVAEEIGNHSEIYALANGLAQYLLAVDGPIIANWGGSRHPNAHGLSVYLPAYNISPYYAKQAFADSGWGKMLQLSLTKTKKR